MKALTAARIAGGTVALGGLAAARAAHQTTEPKADQPTPGRRVGRAALVAAAATPLGLAYMFPFTSATNGLGHRAIITAVGGLQFAATAGLVSYINHNGGRDGSWNSALGSMLLSAGTGAAFGAAGGAITGKGNPKAIAAMAAMGFVGGFPDGGWIQLFNRPGHDGLADLGSWARGDVPR